MPMLIGDAGGTDSVLAVDYKSRTGLSIHVAGIPVVQGSWFHYVVPGTIQPVYSSIHHEQTVTKTSDGNLLVTFRSKDGRAFGSQLVSRTAKGVRIQFTFDWRGPEKAKVSLVPAMFWSPTLEKSKLHVNGTSPLELSASLDATLNPSRVIASNAHTIRFEGPIGNVEVKGSRPEWTLSDNRGGNRNWTPNEVLRLESTEFEINPNSPINTNLNIEFEPKTVSPRVATVSMVGSPLPSAIQARTNTLPLIPKPKQVTYQGSEFFTLDEKVTVDTPLGTEFALRELYSATERIWEEPLPRFKPSTSGNMILRVESSGLPPEAYEIRVTPTSVIVVGQDPQGLKWGMQTLANLIQVKNGKFVLPVCAIRDWPSVRWRGVHVFGGPNVLKFHTQLANRVIKPLRYNNVVFQCERTHWETLPYLRQPNYSERDQLKKVFALYRNLEIEPIPLIQSLGHMEWMFTEGSDTSLAVNPKVPYTIDLRQQKAKELLEKLWDEVATLLKPKYMHFGCDEIDIRGMATGNPSFSSELWEATMPVLGKIAKKHKATGIIWGDKVLAPGQAIDAALGDNPGEAERRRRAIPEGFWIADWHYKNDPRPDRYLTSLNLFANYGFFPIACGWFNPDNIRGFTEAAYKTGSGYLQTTWAGHQFDENAILKEIRQFGAYVMASDYAWSGRKQSASELGYDPEQVFARMFYDEPSPVQAREGRSLGTGATFNVGNVRFRAIAQQELATMIDPEKQNLATELNIKTSNLSGKGISLAFAVQYPSQDRKELADIELELEDGTILTRTLQYGIDVRAASDTKPTLRSERNGAYCANRFSFPEPTSVKRINIKSKNSYVGLKLVGVTTY